MGRYKQLIHEAGYSDNYWNDLQLWDVEELEILEPILNQGTSLVEIMQGKEKSPYKDWFLKNYLFFEKGHLFEENIFLKTQLDKFGEVVKENFFR